MLITNFEVHMKHVKVLVKWRWWWNFNRNCTIPLNFEIYFLKCSWKIVFGVISGNSLYLELLVNTERTVIYLTIILVQEFCPLRTEITQFPTGFRIKSCYTYLLFQLAAKIYSTCQDIFSLRHFLDIILMTCSARGTSLSHLVTSFTLNSKNSASRIIPCAKTVLSRSLMGRTRRHAQ